MAEITSYHAHVYYDAATKPAAETLRAEIEARFPAQMGRWHDRPVGPHPEWSYQVAFTPDLFPELVPWLALNRRGLDVFVHPNTGDDIADHTDHVMWLGNSATLNIDALR